MRDPTSYPIKEAIVKVKKDSKTKFDATVEAHINLGIDVTKQNVRFTITLPHGTGKIQRVAVLSDKKVEQADINLIESDLSKIEKGTLRPKIDFDVFITEPKFMPKIAKVAKILGPAGLMPNPKNGTVTDDIKKAVEQFKKGKIEVRTEQKAPLIHIVIGKISFDNKALEENLNELISNLKKNRPPKAKPGWIKNVYLTSTMGPSVKINLED